MSPGFRYTRGQKLKHPDTTHLFGDFFAFAEYNYLIRVQMDQPIRRIDTMAEGSFEFAPFYLQEDKQPNDTSGCHEWIISRGRLGFESNDWPAHLGFHTYAIITDKRSTGRSQVWRQIAG